MPLPFSLVCDLLDQAYDLSLACKDHAQVVVDWFARHRHRVASQECNLAALLSTLLPEKRTDRVYCIQAPRLEKIIGRALMLGSSRIRELAAYKQPGRGLDLGDCVQRILSATPNHTQLGGLQIACTVEEIDDVLHSIASRIKWSSPSIRTFDSVPRQPDASDLEAVYRKLSAREAKWLTRLVLKDYQPLIFEPHLVYRSCDPMLPFVLKIQDDFAIAIQSMQLARLKVPLSFPRPPFVDRELLATVKPRLSVKVGRQTWFKARSIKHCLDLCKGRMSVESKMDGEYCQIHVDVSKGRRGIQIFSKSGKDSTEDRLSLHDIIFKSLRIGQPDCNIQKECILEGELLVYSDHEKKILPFHHIRNHVTRRGRFLHTEFDSRPRSYEHLMIVYYDMLLLDWESLLSARHSERFSLLQKTVHTDKGLAELVPRQIIDTGSVFAASALRKAFAKVILDKGEGLVLKPDQPYFNFQDNGPFSGRCIKLKKEYIGNFGEVGDFAVVGAGFNPSKAKSYGIQDLQWTHFYIGCLDNREKVKRWGATPELTVVNEVELNATMLKTLVSYGATVTVPVDENQATRLRLTPGVEIGASMTVAFTNPPIFDVKCFGFEKAANTGFWGLRFPAVAKIHFDRDLTDTVSFKELQGMAQEAVTAPVVEDSQENLAWIAKLEGADPRGVAVDACTPSPRWSDVSASCPSIAGAESQTSIRGPCRLTNSFSEMQSSGQYHGKKRKASSPLHSRDSQSHKRCKSLDMGPVHDLSKTRSSRHPLEDIDGNSSQPLTTPQANDTGVENLKSCKLAGSRCQLAKKLILLASKPVGEVRSLLDAHGLLSKIVIDAEAWAEEDKSRFLSTQEWGPGPNKLVLVDTVEMKEETERLLGAMERIRSDIPEEKRDWIGVYDWRVLKHISILEDDGVISKYYDGFHNPWRRWYSGLL